VLELHIHGGERVEIYLIIHGDTKLHSEVETGPSKDTNPRLASFSAEIKTVIDVGVYRSGDCIPRSIGVKMAINYSR
jgi:hypothetical protein